MKRGLAILIGGLAAGVGAYLGLYFACTVHCRVMARSPEPELAWLKEEFHVSDAEFARISQMHDSYLSGCAERCRLIDEKNQQLTALLAATNTMTPEIQKVLGEAAQLRAACQAKMLQHFYEVSKTMPPEQGKRYLEWVHAQTILSDSHKEMQH
jgi:hypothetical protein